MKISLILFIILIPVVSADIVINEIMPNPLYDESLNEWIELYNNGDSEVDVSGWLIGDDSELDVIEGGLYNGGGTVIPAKGYAIITDDTTRVYNNFNVDSDVVRLYVEDSSIGNGLRNSGENIYLYDDSVLIYNVSYLSSETGKSLALLNNSWYLADPTPGFDNSGFMIRENGTCDWKIEIILNKTLFNREDFDFRVRATNLYDKKTNITGRIYISDFFGNIVKEYKPWTNSSATLKRTSSKYTPNLDKGMAYLINATLQISCNESDLTNNYDTKLFAIYSSARNSESSLKIEKIYDLGNDNKAKFGQTIRVKAQIHKGETTKNSIALWVANEDERVSKESKTNVYSEYTNYTLTLPVQLKPNCDQNYEDGQYTLFMEGLDLEDSLEMDISGFTKSMCEEVVVEKKTSSGKLDYRIVEIDKSINLGREFVTKVRLENTGDDGFPVAIWSYVYRGPKTYSGDREDNKRAFYLEGGSISTVELGNIVLDADPGDYKLKVLINKDEQKTNKQLIEDINVIGIQTKEEKQIVQVKDSESLKEEQIQPSLYPNYVKYKEPYLVYESNDFKAKKMITSFLIIVLGMFVVYLILKKE